MGQNLTQKLIETHLVGGRPVPGEPIALRIDQTLTQDATGTLVMLEFEAMGLLRVKTELSAQIRGSQSASDRCQERRGSFVPVQRLPKVRPLV